MDPLIFEGCAYEGGFEHMAPSPRAKLTISDDRFVLQRPRAFGRTILKVWARWTAVRQFEVTGNEGGGVRIEITTGKLGPGVVTIPIIEPMDIWSRLADVEAFRPHIPAEACVELEIEPAPADLVAPESTDEPGRDVLPDDPGPGAGG